MESINSTDDNIDSAKPKEKLSSSKEDIQNSWEREKIDEKKSQAKESQNLQANLLTYFLSISEDIKNNDFDIKIKEDVPIIFSKSSYFSSLIWLNGKEEKEKCLNNKINRNIYDEFDNKIKSMWDQPSEKEKNELIKFCKQNWIDFNSIATNWWCAVKCDTVYCVWIKDTPIISKLNDTNDRI